MRFDTVFDILFPPRCLNCRKNVKSGNVLCEACAGSVSLNQNLFCGKCQARLPGGASAKAGPATIRSICHRDFPYLLGAATQYDTPVIKNLIHGLKFGYVKNAAKPLAEFLIEYIENLALALREYVVIPLPLSAARFRQREFNQSELIARIFAEHFQLPFEAKTLLRTKHSKPQSETKNLIERRDNIKECFAVNDPGPVNGRNIILIDDVTTSGATLFEAATALKSAGAGKILALTVARA